MISVDEFAGKGNVNCTDKDPHTRITNPPALEHTNKETLDAKLPDISFTR
jgi:hypothetical protein